jgi:PmbA protein
MSDVNLDNISRFVNELIKKGFDDVAAKVEVVDSVMTKIANSSVSIVQNWKRTIVDLYLAKNRRIFVLHFEPKSFKDLQKHVDSVISLADRVTESPIYAPLPEPSKVRYVEEVIDKRIIEAANNMNSIAERVIEAAHRENIESVAGMMQVGYNEIILSSSKGALLEEKKTFVQGYLRAFAQPDGSGQWCYTSTTLDLSGLESMAFTASRYAVDSRNRSEIEPGVYDVILSPMVFANLLEYITSMASAMSVIMGWSMFMKNRPGDVVASQLLTLQDEPRNTELPNFRSFDDEGVETCNKLVIEGGVLRTLLHNTKTAKYMNTTTTANAGWINPVPWNIVVRPGSATLDEMVSEVRRGLFITNNWYTRLQNYVEGMFSTVARDAIFYIENGKIVKPVTKIRIADKLGNILKNVAIVGRELYNIQWWEVGIPMKTPYILVKSINISKHTI